MQNGNTKMGFKESLKKYAPYFVDFWQYLIILIIILIGAIFIL